MRALFFLLFKFLILLKKFGFVVFAFSFSFSKHEFEDQSLTNYTNITHCKIIETKF